jgi:hypothetical protein
MYQTVLNIHSYWAFATLALVLVAALNAFTGISSKRAFLNKDRQLSLVALIFSHIQLVLGIVLVFITPKLDAAKAAGMGGVMKDSALRLFFVEHPLINIIAITLITIGWSKHKKQIDDTNKFKKIAYLYSVALLLLLSRIPWDQWLG